MQKSETIGNLAGALVKVQGKLAGAKKDSTNPFFKSKYADLSSVWDACRELLSENGLSVVQTMSLHDGYSIVVDTTLIHSSGEWISGQLGLKAVKDDPQGAGSAVTYARRYALAAIVGIAPEDDDAEAATSKRPSQSDKPTSKPAQKPPPPTTPSTSEGPETAQGTLVFKNVGELYTACNKLFKIQKTDVDKELEGVPNLDLTNERGRGIAFAHIKAVFGGKPDEEGGAQA